MLPKPKKSLGQNFLVDENIRSKIVDACELKKSDCLLEIGAGRGRLTAALAQRAAWVFAVELDRRLLPQLEARLKGQDNIQIISHDILRLDLRRLWGRKRRLKVVGNIPYNITTPIIEHLLDFRDMIDSVFISVQKEFAERITASCGSKRYGSFSCFIQYYFYPQILFSIKKSSFGPAPKVDSSFLRLKIRKAPAVKTEDPQLLFKLIRAAFNQRRKTIRNSLKKTVSKEKLKRFLENSRIGPDARAQELSLSDFARLLDS